jgi:hypothetical protein
LVSLRTLINCIDDSVPSTISVLRHFYGYIVGHPRKRIDSPAVSLSLLRQIRLILGKHIHINLIRVGVENFNTEHERELDFAVYLTREIYAVSSVRLGIGRVRRFFISDEDAQELGIYGSVLVDDNAGEITDDFNGPGDAIDIFVVLAWGSDYDTLGRSEVDGPCDKTYDLFQMTGSVISIDKTEPGRSGRTLAHELAHYLGLPHPDEIVNPVDDPGPGQDINSSSTSVYTASAYNLMADPDELDVEPGVALDLTPAQGKLMRSHCFVKPGCLSHG